MKRRHQEVCRARVRYDTAGEKADEKALADLLKSGWEVSDVVYQPGSWTYYHLVRWAK